MEIRLVTKPGCPFCDKAKDWLNQHGLSYHVEVIDDQQVRLAFYQQHGVNSMPQVFVNNKLLGGYTELVQQGPVVFKRHHGGLLEYSKTYKPFTYTWAVDTAKKHEKVHWIEEEVDLGEDVMDWKAERCTATEKSFITQILRLFTQSDVAVGQNYYDFFIPHFKNNEIRNMLGSFAAREAIHQRAYALLNDTLGLSDDEYQKFLEYKAMADKISFMGENDASTKRGLGLALVKSVFCEGVMLFASFAMLLSFQRQGKMKGMGKVIEWSVRDESIHVEGISALFRAYCEEHPRIVDDSFKKDIYEMAKAVVKLEDKFVDLAFNDDGVAAIAGLTAPEIKQFIRYIADRRLLQLGMKPVFRVKDNPLLWMEWVLNGADHTNFFENRVTDYQVGSLTGKWSEAYTKHSAPAPILACTETACGTGIPKP